MRLLLLAWLKCGSYEMLKSPYLSFFLKNTTFERRIPQCTRYYILCSKVSRIPWLTSKRILLSYFQHKFSIIKQVSLYGFIYLTLLLPLMMPPTTKMTMLMLLILVCLCVRPVLSHFPNPLCMSIFIGVNILQIYTYIHHQTRATVSLGHALSFNASSIFHDILLASFVSCLFKYQHAYYNVSCKIRSTSILYRREREGVRGKSNSRT